MMKRPGTAQSNVSSEYALSIERRRPACSRQVSALSPPETGTITSDVGPATTLAPTRRAR